MSRDFCVKNKDCFLLNGHPGECADHQSWDNEPRSTKPLRLTRLGCLVVCAIFFAFLLLAYALSGKDQGTPGNYCDEFPQDSVCLEVK